MSGDDRRAFERFDAQHPARATLPSGAELECRVENIGELGVYLSTADLDGVIEVGDVVTVALERNGVTLERKGEVLRHDQEFTSGEIRRSFAVRFAEPIEL
jgi:hypothetical protein